MINYMLNGKDISFNSWIDKKVMAYMSEYFPKPNYLGENVDV